MELIKRKINKFRISKPKKELNAGWEVLADEMTDYFGENCYWLFYKKDEWKIRDAFKICKDKRISSFKYLLGILKKLK